MKNACNWSNNMVLSANQLCCVYVSANLFWIKKYDQAYIAADSIGSPLQVYQILHVLYLKSGDYEKAYTYNKLIHKHQDSINRLVQSTDIAELNAQIGNERMKLDAKALEYKNAALNLRNTQLELERTKSQSELEKINAENSKLVLKN